jgi:superfamily I DNA/RNA helicase
MKDVVAEDLKVNGINSWTLGDGSYEERTKHYKAVGDDDVVWYATKICEKDGTNTPVYDLILIDEFQDFNENEARFIEVLSSKNKVLIVGDDDQALYEFKGSSPKYIRGMHHVANEKFERHALRFCSRCTEVIIGAFHDVVAHFDLSVRAKERVQKEYLCYLPDKKQDSDANPKICLSEQTKVGAIPHFIRYQLEALLEHQKIKSVLVIGEGRTCKALLSDIAKKLRDFGFRYVDHRQTEGRPYSFKQRAIDGYKVLAKGKNELLAWRLLSELLGASEREKLLTEHYANASGFIGALPKKFRETHQRNADVFDRILEKPESARKHIAASSLDRLAKEIVESQIDERDLLMGQLIQENKVLPRPLNGLDITVTNILGSKGLGADVVFLVGFDQGKFPAKKDVLDGEIYQMLVALTRAKKRIYLVNTIGSERSLFRECIKGERIETM